ncbi:MAG: hypothetical protein E7018_03635 [Alphaproteobacteria bacterium]|nr:hypothetical protein [Alphaproteobacteria bacterium]
MQKILAKISNLSHAYKGKTLNPKELIICQKKLSQQNRPTIPSAYIEILQQFNSLHYDGRCIFGINPTANNFLDILSENQLSNIPDPHASLILGSNDFEYLQWTPSQNSYQIIDKHDFSVLNTYLKCSDAIFNFLMLKE